MARRLGRCLVSCLVRILLRYCKISGIFQPRCWYFWFLTEDVCCVSVIVNRTRALVERRMLDAKKTNSELELGSAKSYFARLQNFTNLDTKLPLTYLRERQQPLEATACSLISSTRRMEHMISIANLGQLIKRLSFWRSRQDFLLFSGWNLELLEVSKVDAGYWTDRDPDLTFEEVEVLMFSFYNRSAPDTDESLDGCLTQSSRLSVDIYLKPLAFISHFTLLTPNRSSLHGKRFSLWLL